MAMVEGKMQPGAPDFKDAKEWSDHYTRQSVFNHLAQSALKHVIWLGVVVALAIWGNLSDIFSIQIDWTIGG